MSKELIRIVLCSYGMGKIIFIIETGVISNNNLFYLIPKFRSNAYIQYLTIICRRLNEYC